MSCDAGIRIRLLRGEQCLTKAELARRCGVQPSVIAAIETGDRIPWPRLVADLARELEPANGSADRVTVP